MQWQSRRRDRLASTVDAPSLWFASTSCRRDAWDEEAGHSRHRGDRIRCARHSGHQSVHHFAHHFGLVQSRRPEAPRLRPRGSICVTSKPSYLLSYGNAMSQLILTCCDRITITLCSIATAPAPAYLSRRTPRPIQTGFHNRGYSAT